MFRALLRVILLCNQIHVPVASAVQKYLIAEHCPVNSCGNFAPSLNISGLHLIVRVHLLLVSLMCLCNDIETNEVTIENYANHLVLIRGMQLGSGKLQHTSVISVKHADADKPPSLYLAPMASQNYLFGSLTDGDTAILNNHFYRSKTNIGQALSIYYFMRISRIVKYNFNPMAEKTLQEVGGARYHHLSLSTGQRHFQRVILL
ncbi:hypothetical protein NQ317_011712 [Molorchus minor]|uniref:Uncharacterized protein n=1 Tax=Molorchus minor TaxID=1323400 RepID=A0ABQ9J418_9CUCU|nr:hypothetical protein NQ317_011712 [Molorchus minor]